MLYSPAYYPAHYEEQRLDLNLDVVRRFEFATLIAIAEEGPFISHLPLVLEESGKYLIGHCARANPLWRHFSAGNSVTAIFNGPHAYISPAWYQPKPGNVPTWNYVAVHVTAKAELIEDACESYEVMRKLVGHFEAKYKTEWNLPESVSEELKALLKGIVTFRLTIENVQGKFKLGQQQNPIDRQKVIEQLPKYLGSEGSAVASYMESVLETSRR